MKKHLSWLVLSSFIFCLTIGLVISCEKNYNKNDKPASQKVIQKAAGVVYVIKCKGLCEDESACKMEGSGYIVQCNCEGCVMEIKIRDTQTVPQDSTQVISYFQGVEHFIDSLDSFVYEQTSESGYLIDEIEFSYGTGYYYIIYRYTTDSNIQGSVLYCLVAGKKWEVDCHGSCDSETEKCVEIFNAQTGETSCACESDNCSMTVEEIE